MSKPHENALNNARASIWSKDHEGDGYTSKNFGAWSDAEGSMHDIKIHGVTGFTRKTETIKGSDGQPIKTTDIRVETTTGPITITLFLEN